MNYKNHEDVVLLSYIRQPGSKILDVGCGLGRYLIPLSKEGYQVYGVDKNPKTVDYLHSKDYPNVYTVEESSQHLPMDFDYIIMSHIIEHIFPQDLVAFLDNYLDHLKVGGKLLIATPFFHKHFFDDYDHLKPYTPNAISLLFSNYEQLQEKPKHRLKLDNLWIRRDPYELDIYPIMGSRRKRIIKRLNKLLIFFYTISYKYISEKTGWIGVFSRTE